MPKKDWMVKTDDLDDDQLHVFNAMLDKSCIVTGCAGSGKSVLALIKAQRIQKEKGNNYQIIVYTKALSSYMASGKETLGLNNNFTYHWSWKNTMGMPSADYTIVDEIQDFTKEEIGEFINATNKHFFFFGDTAQSVYKAFKDTLPVEDILYSFPDYRKTTSNFALYRNYRLPWSVAKIAQHIGEDLPPLAKSIYRSTETQQPYLLRYPTAEEQAEAIIKIIKDRGFDDVAILMPDSVSVKNFSSLLSQRGMKVEHKYKGDIQEVNTLNFGTNLPKVMTYHSAKGLQFEAVFIPMIPQIIPHRTPLYVAMTRTYHFLYLMYSGNMPDLLAEIPKGEYLETTDTTVEDK